jgi:phosphorylcholine metabolism protein LicD
MGPSIPEEINLINLTETCKALNNNNISYSVFFGTALGIQRNNSVIDGDDDVDILVHSDYYNEIKTIMENIGYEVQCCDVKNIFIQFSKNIHNKKVILDIYFYCDHNNDNINLKWNFRPEWNIESNHLIIPKSMIFKTKTIKINGVDIHIPNKLEETCKFLYGDKYNERLKRNEYSIKIVNNKPQITYNK